MNKVKSSLKKKLQKIASMLPPEKTGRMEIRILLGQQLIDHGTVKDGSGQRIIARKNYRCDVPEYVNHYARLKAAYEQGGPVAVKEYTDKYIINKAPSVSDTSGA